MVSEIYNDFHHDASSAGSSFDWDAYGIDVNELNFEVVPPERAVRRVRGPVVVEMSLPVIGSVYAAIVRRGARWFGGSHWTPVVFFATDPNVFAKVPSADELIAPPLFTGSVLWTGGFCARTAIKHEISTHGALAICWASGEWTDEAGEPLTEEEANSDRWLRMSGDGFFPGGVALAVFPGLALARGTNSPGC